MIKCKRRIAEIEKRQKELRNNAFGHLSAWQLLWTKTPPGVNEEYTALEKEKKQIYKSDEWKEEISARLKIYRQDERYVKLEQEIHNLSVASFAKMGAYGYQPDEQKKTIAEQKLSELANEIDEKMFWSE